MSYRGVGRVTYKYKEFTVGDLSPSDRKLLWIIWDTELNDFEIAAKLNIKYNALHMRLHRLYGKVGLIDERQCRLRLIQWALRRGFYGEFKEGKYENSI